MTNIKPKIAFITSVDVSLKVLILAQIKKAQKEGFEVYGICSEGPNISFLTQQGVSMYPVKIKRSISPFSDAVALFKIYSFLKKNKVDIVHAHTPKPVLLVPIAGMLAGVPIRICTLRGYMVREGLKPLPRFFYKWLAWISASCSSFLLCQNPEDVQRYITAGVCKPEKIAPLGNGVNLKSFDPGRFSEEYKKNKRIELGIPEDDIVLCIIGRLVREKGYFELFEAFSQIIKTKNNIWLLIIGPEEPEKLDRISPDTFEQFAIESRTKYLGARDDIPELLSICDIFALPSWREGFPRSAIEAAAMKLPIVTTDIQGCRQVVQDGMNGILVPSQNPQALQAALLRLIDNPDLRINMGMAGHKKAQIEFDEEVICNKVISLYNSLADPNNKT